MVGELDVADGLCSHPLTEMAAQVALGDMHVMAVPVYLDPGRVDGLDDLHRRSAAIKTVALVIDADVHWLEDQHDLVFGGDGRSLLQTLDDRLVHLLLVDTGDVVAADYA